MSQFRPLLPKTEQAQIEASLLTGQVDEEDQHGDAEWEAQRHYTEMRHGSRPLNDVAKMMKAERSFDSTHQMYEKRVRQCNLGEDDTGHRSEGVNSQARVLKRSSDILSNGYKKHGPGLPAKSLSPYLSVPSEKSVYLRAPSDIWQLEQMFKNINIYFTGSFKDSTWWSIQGTDFCHSTEEDLNLASVSDLSYLVWNAYSLFHAGEVAKTAKTWALVSTVIEDIAKSENIRTSGGFSCLAVDLYQLGWFEIGRELLKQCSRMIALFYTVHHPLYQAFDYLARVPASMLKETALASLKKVVDALEATLGATHVTTLSERSRLIQMAGHSNHQSQLLSLMKHSMHKNDEIYGPLDPQSMDIRIEYTVLLLHNKRHDEALAEAKLLLSQLDGLESSPQNGQLDISFRYDVILITASAYEALGEVDSAEFYYREKLKLAVACWGDRSLQVIQNLEYLERFLRDVGKCNAADEIHVQRITAQEEYNYAVSD